MENNKSEIISLNSLIQELFLEINMFQPMIISQDEKMSREQQDQSQQQFFHTFSAENEQKNLCYDFDNQNYEKEEAQINEGFNFLPQQIPEQQQTIIYFNNQDGNFYQERNGMFFILDSNVAWRLINSQQAIVLQFPSFK